MSLMRWEAGIHKKEATAIEVLRAAWRSTGQQHLRKAEALKR